MYAVLLIPLEGKEGKSISQTPKIFHIVLFYEFDSEMSVNFYRVCAICILELVT